MCAGKLATAGLVLGALASASTATAADHSNLAVEIKLSNERFFRGANAPVKDLDVTVVLSNTSDKIALTVPQPRMDPVGIVDFEVDLLGVPTGVPATGDEPEKTRILRAPGIQPVDTILPAPNVFLGPKESKEFTIDIGGWFAIRAAGRYQATCLFEDARSNTVEFEVLPLKRVDVPAHLLLGRLEDYERGGPDFPFMFYVTRGPGRFDTILFLTRHGTGADEHYEPRWLGQIATDAMPQMVTQEAKVGLVVPDKKNDSVSWKYVVDFGRRPVIVTGDKIVHTPGSGPTASVE
jgi:hypothetical protein